VLLVSWQPNSDQSGADNMKAVVRRALTARSDLGEGESRQGPSGTDMLTSAFAESTRAPRLAAAAYPDSLMTDACLPLEASVRRGWRESSKRSSASVGAGPPFVAKR
jgi:hypothetical protein